jgi:acid phosphatase family membrane protein YuiD
MAEIASAYVSLIPSAKGFGSKMDSQLGGEVQSSGKRLGSTFGKMFAVGGALVAAAGIGKLVGDSIGEAREAQKVAALTAQVIKTTGGIANVTAKQVDSLASSISAKTGIDDEQIASASNLLLTFKDVRNEAGAGNDIFNQATKASVDMAAAMAAASGGQVDFRSSSTMLGKALNDPIKGLAAMGRVGIQFNEVQKEQITGLVESGQKMKAQKVILAELESQFGGAAAASSTAGEKASVAFGNLKEDIGTALLPAVDGLANAFIKISPAISKGIGAVGPALASARSFLAPFAAQIQGLFGGEGGGGLAAGLRSFGATIQTNLLPVLQTMANTFTTRIVPAVASLVTYVVSSLVPVFSQVWSIISTRVLPIISSLAQFFYGTLYPALIDIYTTVAQKFKPVFTQLVATIQAKVLPAADDMLKKFQEWQPTIQKVISLVVKIAGKWLEFQAEIVAKVLPVIIRLAGFLISKIVPAVADVIGIAIKIIAKMIEFGGALIDAVQKAGPVPVWREGQVWAGNDVHRRHPREDQGRVHGRGHPALENRRADGRRLEGGHRGCLGQGDRRRGKPHWEDPEEDPRHHGHRLPVEGDYPDRLADRRGLGEGDRRRREEGRRGCPEGRAGSHRRHQVNAERVPRLGRVHRWRVRQGCVWRGRLRGRA